MLRQILSQKPKVVSLYISQVSKKDRKLEKMKDKMSQVVDVLSELRYNGQAFIYLCWKILLIYSKYYLMDERNH